MNSFNGLQPPLEPAERAIVKDYGGWGNFMASYGLKPYEMEHADEGLDIVQGLAHSDAENAKAEPASGTKK